MKQNQTDSTEPKKPHISIHQSIGVPDFRKKADGTKTPVVRKKTRRFHQTPVTTLPEDNELDEVLDDLTTDSAIEELPIDEVEPIPVKENRQFSIFQRIKERKPREAEASTVSTFIRQKSGFSEDDVDMLLALGYENELGRIVGYESLKKLKQDHNMRVGKSNRRHYRTSFGYCGLEDVNARTEASVSATYAYHRRRLILRTLLTLAITVLLFLLDCPAIFGGVYENFLLSHPLIVKIISPLLLIAACMLSWRQVNAGIRSYFKLTPTPYSSVGILLPFALIYNIAAFFTSDTPLRVNPLIAGILLLLAVCDVLRLACEMRTMRLLCAEGDKIVLESVEPRKRKLRQGKKLVKIINDDIDEHFYRVRRAEETSGFFRRFNDLSSTNRPFHILLGMPPIIAFVCAFAALLITGNPSTAISLFMTVMLVAAPFSAIFSFFYPLCRANKLLSQASCALIGDESVEEFGESTTIIFPDTDLYTAEQCTEISVRDGDDFRQDLRLAALLFCKTGGTLATVGNSYGGKGIDAPVTFVRVTESGIEAIAEESRHMIAGSADFLKKNGIRVPRESSDKALRRTPNVGVMYVAIDGILKLSYEIEYTEKPDFERIVRDLADIDIGIAIRSYDPNLNELFLLSNRPEGAIPIRVIKPGRHEPDTTLKTADTGAVALGSTSDIVYPLRAASNVRAVKRFGTVLQYILSVVGIVGTTALSFTPLNAYLTPLTLAAYHLGGIFITLIATQFYLNKRTLQMRKQEPKNMRQQAPDTPAQ